MGRIAATSISKCQLIGRRVVLVVTDLCLCAPSTQMASVAAGGLQNFIWLVVCLRAVTTIGLHMKVNWKRAINEGLGSAKNSDMTGSERKHAPRFSA